MELLKDVKVLELGYFYPVPFCAKLLNYLGAEVIKIEPPSGDPSRLLGPIFAGFNYNKEIIKLDLKKFEDREVFYKLAKSSDVIIEGFRPGVVKRLGVDYETIRKLIPKSFTAQFPLLVKELNYVEFLHMILTFWVLQVF